MEVKLLKKVIKKIEKLNIDKSKLVAEEAKLRKQIDDIDIELKNYSAIKKEYEKLEKRFADLTNIKMEEKNG